MSEKFYTTPPHESSTTGNRTLVTLASLFLVLIGIKLAAVFLIPVVVAFFLSVLAYPLMRLLMRMRFPYPVALIVTVLFIVSLLILFINAGTGLLVDFSKEVPDDLRKLQVYVNDAGQWLESKGVTGAEDAVKKALNWQEMIGYAKEADVRNVVTKALGAAAGTVAEYAALMTTILILMCFILSEARGTHSRVEAVLHAGGPDLKKLLNSATDIQKYLGIKTILSAMCGLLAGILCHVVGLEYPILWALLAFALHFIPAVGAMVAGVLPFFVALVKLDLGHAIAVAVGYFAINFLIGNFIEPMLMGRRFGVSPFVVVLSVWFWGWMWGPIGAFLAVPLTIMIKVVMENSNEFRWLSVAMSKKKVKHGEIVLDVPELDESEMLGGGAATEPPH
ncbi:MAG: AI-2E family transporter [Verrucomicrobiaceae bacterium]